MASNVRFLDQVPVSAYGNSSVLTINTGSFMVTGSVDGSNLLTFTKADGSTFNLQVAASASSADSLTTASISGQILTFTKGDATTFPITIPSGGSIATGSLLTTGSVSLNTLTFTKGNGDTFDLTVDTGSGGGGSATLSQALTANLTVGGVTSGETFTQGSTIEALLRDMLITYQEPTLSSLSIKNGGSAISTSTRDVGESFSCDNATFTAGVDSPNGDYPQSASLSCTGADIGSFSETGPTDVQASNTVTFSTARTISKATAAGSVTFTVSTTSRNSGDTQSTSRSFSFQFRNYLAASSTVISDGTTLQSVLDSDTVQSPFDTNKSWTATCGAANNSPGNFTYIIYPASYGDLSGVIQDGATPVLGAFTKLSDQTANNNQGSSLTWRIYKSNADQAFADGTSLAIS